MNKVILLETSDRKKGVVCSMKALGINPVKNKDMLIKPNFNTADITPGSTHNDTLSALIDQIWDMGAKSIALGERSYPVTRKVIDQKGVMPLLEEKDVELIDFNELDQNDLGDMWVSLLVIHSGLQKFC